MYIARLLYPVKVLGPGNRIGIWFSGCSHHCPGCSNPELWQPLERHRTSVAAVLQLIGQLCRTGPVDGFTLTGGDPFAQPEALAQLLPALAQFSPDILVYTGFTHAQLQKTHPALLQQIGVLIDGPYIQAQNTGALLRGSDNQNIIVLDQQLQPLYSRYLATAKNEIQNFTAMDGVISVGIHKPDYPVQLDAALKGKGLKKQ